LILPPDLEQFNEFASDILIEEEHLLWCCSTRIVLELLPNPRLFVYKKKPDAYVFGPLEHKDRKFDITLGMDVCPHFF
jgi:hypothetical protein